MESLAYSNKTMVYILHLLQQYDFIVDRWRTSLFAVQPFHQIKTFIWWNIYQINVYLLFCFSCDNTRLLHSCLLSNHTDNMENIYYLLWTFIINYGKKHDKKTGETLQTMSWPWRNKVTRVQESSYRELIAWELKKGKHITQCFKDKRNLLDFKFGLKRKAATSSVNNGGFKRKKVVLLGLYSVFIKHLTTVANMSLSHVLTNKHSNKAETMWNIKTHLRTLSIHTVPAYTTCS